MSGSVSYCSAYPVDAASTYWKLWVGNGSQSKHEYGLGVAASLTSVVSWDLRFKMPAVIPTETMKLYLLALSAATSGGAKINPRWVSVSPGENPSSKTLVAEGTQTVTWGATDDYKYKSLKVTLDGATAPSANDILVMKLEFVNTSWTLASESCWFPYIIWE